MTLSRRELMSLLGALAGTATLPASAADDADAHPSRRTPPPPIYGVPLVVPDALLGLAAAEHDLWDTDVVAFAMLVQRLGDAHLQAQLREPLEELSEHIAGSRAALADFAARARRAGVAPGERAESSLAARRLVSGPILRHVHHWAQRSPAAAALAPVGLLAEPAFRTLFVRSFGHLPPGPCVTASCGTYFASTPFAAPYLNSARDILAVPDYLGLGSLYVRLLPPGVLGRYGGIEPVSSRYVGAAGPAPSVGDLLVSAPYGLAAPGALSWALLRTTALLDFLIGGAGFDASAGVRVLVHEVAHNPGVGPSAAEFGSVVGGAASTLSALGRGLTTSNKLALEAGVRERDARRDQPRLALLAEALAGSIC